MKGVGPRWPGTLPRGTIRYMAVVGDRVQISSRKVGEASRDGVVTGVTGSLLRVRWSTGEESTVVPSMGSLAVVGKQSGGGGRRRQTTSASATKGQVGTRAVPGRVAALKQVTKAVKESGQATPSQTAQKAAKVAAQPKKVSKLPR